MRATRLILWTLVLAVALVALGPLAATPWVAGLDVGVVEDGLLAPNVRPADVDEVVLLEIDEAALAGGDDPWAALIAVVELLGNAPGGMRPRHLIVLPPQGVAPTRSQSQRLAEWHERWDTLWVPWPVSPAGRAAPPWPGAREPARLMLDGARQLVPGVPAGTTGVRSQASYIEVRLDDAAVAELPRSTARVPHVGTRLIGHAETSLPARLRFDGRLVAPLLERGRRSVAPLLLRGDGERALNELQRELAVSARWVVLGVTAPAYAGEPVALPARDPADPQAYVAPAVAETLVLRAFAGGRWIREVPLTWQLTWLVLLALGSMFVLHRLPVWGLAVWAAALLLAWLGLAFVLYDGPRPMYAAPWGTLALVFAGLCVEGGRRFYGATKRFQAVETVWRDMAAPARRLREGGKTPRQSTQAASAQQSTQARAAEQQEETARLRQGTATRRREVARTTPGIEAVPPVDVLLDRLANLLRRAVGHDPGKLGAGRLALYVRDPDDVEASGHAVEESRWALVARDVAPDATAPVVERSPGLAGMLRAEAEADGGPVETRHLPREVLERLGRGELVVARSEERDHGAAPGHARHELLVPALTLADEAHHQGSGAYRVSGFVALEWPSTAATANTDATLDAPSSKPQQPHLTLTPAMQAALVGETSRTVDDARWRLAAAHLGWLDETPAEDGSSVRERRLARRLIRDRAQACELVVTAALARGLRLQQALDALPVGLALADTDGQLVAANRIYREQLGDPNAPPPGLKPLAETLALYSGRLPREEADELLDTVAQPVGPSGRLVVPLTLEGRSFRLTVKSLPGLYGHPRRAQQAGQSQIWNRATGRRVATVEDGAPLHAGLLALLEPAEAQARWARVRATVSQLLAERADRWTWAATMRALFELEARLPSIGTAASTTGTAASVAVHTPVGVPASEAYQLCREAARSQGRELQEPSGMAKALGRVEVPLRLRALLRSVFAALIRVWPALAEQEALAMQTVTGQPGLTLHSATPRPDGGTNGGDATTATGYAEALQRAFDEQRRRDTELPKDLAAIGIEVTIEATTTGRLQAHVRWSKSTPEDT